MNFQTVFYNKLSGQILRVMPNAYIKSKWDKMSRCPGTPHEELNFLYFQSDIPVDPGQHTIMFISTAQPPQVVDADGMPLIYMAKKRPFERTIEKYSKIIVDLADSMGDKLYRAAAVIEAQKAYPHLTFFCKCETEYRPIMELIKEITLFDGHKAHGLNPAECGTVTMAAGQLADPRGNWFAAPSRYGLFLGLDHTPYDIKLTIPPGFDDGLKALQYRIGIRADGRNIVMQLRTKNDEGRSWIPDEIRKLAALIKQAGDYNIYYLGTPLDLPDAGPDIINLAGKTTWIETVHLLRSASHVFCIDSGTLHLCHALDIPAYRLWGRTCPEGVIDEPAGGFDIFSSFSGTPSNIKEITAEKVFNHAFPAPSIKAPTIYQTITDHSQHGEQAIIFKWFTDHPPRHSTLVDVGAFGKEISNTYALCSLGWKGLLIEANPDRAAIVKEDFAGMDVTVENIGISSTTGAQTLYLHSTPGHDSFLPDWYPQTKTKKTAKIQVVPLASVLKDQHIPLDFDFLSIDTEGLDLKIIKKLFTSSKYRPSLICIETQPDSDTIALFDRFGYALHARTGPAEFENLFFVKKK